MADAKNQIAQGGHVVRIMAGGHLVGYGRSASAQQNYGTEGAYALGAVGPFENNPLKWSARITLDQFVIQRKKLNDAVQLMNLAPMGPDKTLEAGLIDFEILDDRDETIMVYEQCTIEGHTYQVTANQFSGQNATFVAKNVREGVHPSMGLAAGPVGRPAE